MKWAEAKSKGTLQQLALLVLTKTVQKLGFFIRIVDVPEVIVIHIAKKARLPLLTKEEWKMYSETRTAKRHFRYVRDYLQLRPFDHEAHHILTDTMNKLAFSKDDPADLVIAAIEELIRLRYELPVYNTLKDAANDVRNKSYRAIYHQIDHALNDEQRKNIDQLFQIPEGTTYSPWNEIKEDAKRATLSHLNDLIVRRNWLINHHIPTDLLQDVPYIKVKQMAAEAKTLGAFRMLEMKSKKRYALTLAFVSMQLSKILDDIGEMLIKRMMSIHKKGRQRLKDHKEKTQKRTDSLISTLHELLLAYQTEGNPEERIQAMQKVLKEQEAQVLQDCENHLAFSGDNYYLFLWQFYKSHRATLFKILKSIPLRSTTQDKALEEAISFLLTHINIQKRNSYQSFTSKRTESGERIGKLLLY
jgi:hypothetical protein